MYAAVPHAHVLFKECASVNPSTLDFQLEYFGTSGNPACQFHKLIQTGSGVIAFPSRGLARTPFALICMGTPWKLGSRPKGVASYRMLLDIPGLKGAFDLSETGNSSGPQSLREVFRDIHRNIDCNGPKLI
jgi:hypothetical protein